MPGAIHAGKRFTASGSARAPGPEARGAVRSE
jgi:hypothetical protein